MKRLILAEGIYGSICSLARKFSDEFAVTLFGEVRGNEYVISHIAPPGDQAENGYIHCTSDPDFEADFFSELRRSHPEIRYLGDLHAHPPGIRSLSRTDRHTIREVLLGTDDTLHPEEYVAGVILRNGDEVSIYARHFTKQDLHGTAMELHYGSVSAQPARAGNIIRQAYRHCRGWLDRQRYLRHGGSGGHRRSDTDRS